MFWVQITLQKRFWAVGSNLAENVVFDTIRVCMLHIHKQRLYKCVAFVADSYNSCLQVKLVISMAAFNSQNLTDMADPAYRYQNLYIVHLHISMARSEAIFRSCIIWK